MFLMADFGSRPSAHVSVSVAPERPQTGLQWCGNGDGESPRAVQSTMKTHRDQAPWRGHSHRELRLSLDY